MKLDIVLEKQAEGGYTAYVPALPGCISEGETKTEAMANIKEAISLYLEETGKSKLNALLKNISVVKADVKAYA